MAREQADVFELRGPAQITYEAGSRELHYSGPTRPPLRDFVEVREVVDPLETPIGTLVTATLRSAEDGDTSTVSVLIPQVNLGDEGAQGASEAVDFSTVAVFTTSRSTIGGPGLVDGAVQLYTEAALEGTARRGAAASSPPCQLTAVLNLGMPGPGRRPGMLRVEGTCELESTGFHIDLVRHEPQGINPRDLLLDLVVTPPPAGEIVAPVLTPYPVLYEQRTTFMFQTVTILPGGPSIDVEIIT
ncbi:MAG: hypothetical protein ACLGI3_10660 [Actinomycetes bacterium]